MTTDRPYTDTDLRTEAARQHALSVEDPDFMGIGERMDGRFIDSTVVDPDPKTGTEPVTGQTWDALPQEDFDAAQRAIDDLLAGAADVSEWAINLGADGLEPSDEHEITLNAGQPIARIHFAFEPDMPDDMRTGLVEGVGDAINEAGIEREDDKPVALPARWECSHGPSDDEAYCLEAEDEDHVCPTIRVHPSDAEQFAALVDEVHRLRVRVDAAATLADRWQEMADQGDTAIGHFEGPAAATLDTEVGERGRIYRKAAVDVRDVMATGRIPHDLMTVADRATVASGE